MRLVTGRRAPRFALLVLLAASEPAALAAPLAEPAWRTFPAAHWFEFTRSYPPEWTLEPVVLLHDRLLLELIAEVRSCASTSRPSSSPFRGTSGS